MDLSEQIVAALRARNAAGETYKQLAKASGITQSYIHGVANHRYLPLKMSLQTFLALFPSARIELAPARVPDDPSDVVPRSEYQDLRDRYQDLRDQYQDLRDRLAELEHPLFPARAATSGVFSYVENAKKESEVPK